MFAGLQNYKINMSELCKILFASTVMGISIYELDIFLVLQGLCNAWAALAVIMPAVVIYGLILLIIGGITGQDIAKIPLIGSRLVFLLTKLGLIKF